MLTLFQKKLVQLTSHHCYHTCSSIIPCLIDHMDLMMEFYVWQKPTHHHSTALVTFRTKPSVIQLNFRRFSYCDHPFILSLSAKKHILQQDSEHQMLMMAKV